MLSTKKPPRQLSVGRKAIQERVLQQQQGLKLCSEKEEDTKVSEVMKRVKRLW